MEADGTTMWRQVLDPRDIRLSATFLSKDSSYFLCVCMLAMGHGYESDARLSSENGSQDGCMIDKGRLLYGCKNTSLDS
jgi:hypothetical protein